MKYLIYFFLICILVSCEDLFLRFKYENYLCSKNIYEINKISILGNKVGTPIQIFIREKQYNFKISEISKKEIVLTHFNPNISLKIDRILAKITGVNQRNTFSLVCKKEAFRI